MQCSRLDQLEWQYVSGEYRLDLTYGRAVIRENTFGSKTTYKPEVRSLSGKILASFPHGLEFEEAQAFTRANLNLLDQDNIDKADFIKKLATTIDICIDKLPQPERRFHQVRLEDIKRWMQLPLYAKMIVPDHTYDWHSHVFEWEHIDGRYLADTFHGKAVIKELETKTSKFSFGNTNHYRSQIIDDTGVVLEDYYVPSLEFAEAEHAVRRLLTDLEIPVIDEVYLSVISFTLQICHCVLPSDADLMHSVRLEYIENYLNEALP